MRSERAASSPGALGRDLEDMDRIHEAEAEIAATRDLVAAEQAATEVTAVLSEKDAMFSLAAEMLVEGEGRDFDVRDC